LPKSPVFSPDNNLVEERPTFTRHLECSLTGDIYPADELHNLSRAGKPLLVRYDLEALAKAIDKETLARRPSGMWRYREFLPVRDVGNIVSLGESETPLLTMPRLAQAMGGGRILLKDESRLPTGSFKARGASVSVSMAKAFGVRHMAMATNGNAGAALSAYASRAGIVSTIFCPEDAPEINVREMAAQGARVFLVNGLINDCGRIVAQGREGAGWFDNCTLREPYRVEGKKTMGLELAEQLGWTVPDVIMYGTGGGTALIAIWKAFEELEAIGWISSKRPRMVAVQASGCAPIVKAFDAGRDTSERWENPRTVANGMRVPEVLGDRLILSLLKDSGGFATSVSDEEILEARGLAARTEGLLMCPEGASTLAAYRAALADGRISPDETAVLFTCASGLKYELPNTSQRIDISRPVDFAQFRV